MEVIMGVILLLQVVILIQIMQGKKQMLQYFKTELGKACVSDEKESAEKVQNVRNATGISAGENRENAMKLVEEVLTEVFS